MRAGRFPAAHGTDEMAMQQGQQTPGSGDFLWISFEYKSKKTELSWKAKGNILLFAKLREKNKATQCEIGNIVNPFSKFERN